jgi:hypothetical protein
MKSFSQAIPVTGPPELPKEERVWFSEVSFFKVVKDGEVTYTCKTLHPNPPGDVNSTVTEGLKDIARKLSSL